MTTRSRPLDRTRQRASVALGDPLAALWNSTNQRWQSAGRWVQARTARPLAAMLGIPLAFAAALGSMQWWAIVPLAGAAWWYAPRDWGWEWLVAIGRGLLLLEWVMIGADALAEYPNQRLLVGVIWALLPAVLVVARAVRAPRARHKKTGSHRPEGRHGVIRGFRV